MSGGLPFRAASALWVVGCVRVALALVGPVDWPVLLLMRKWCGGKWCHI